MKRLLLFTALLLRTASAGDLYQRFQLPLVEGYVDSGMDKEPDIPGMGKTRHYIYLSLSSIDSQASYFSVYIRVKLEDGSSHPILASIYKEGDGPTTARFKLGRLKPVKIEQFYIVRLRPEAADYIVH